MDSTTYDQENYFFSHSDPLINLDYICLAIMSSLRAQLFSRDFMECLQLLLDVPRMNSAETILTIANRIKTVIKRNNESDLILEKDSLPSKLEETIERHSSMRTSEIFSPKPDLDEVNSDVCERSFEDRSNFFKVKEAGAEEEDEDNDDEFVSPQREKNLSMVVDEEGDTFIECTANEEPAEPAPVIEPKQQQPQHFTLKSTKGCVVYDKQTKTKKYMSPFDQFLSQQQDLFKKDNALATQSIPDE